MSDLSVSKIEPYLEFEMFQLDDAVVMSPSGCSYTRKSTEFTQNDNVTTESATSIALHRNISSHLFPVLPTAIILILVFILFFITHLIFRYSKRRFTKLSSSQQYFSQQGHVPLAITSNQDELVYLNQEHT